jgi:hypothetical protein
MQQVLEYCGIKQTNMGLSADSIGEEAKLQTIFNRFNKASKRKRIVQSRTRIYVLFSHGNAWEIIVSVD